MSRRYRSHWTKHFSQSHNNHGHHYVLLLFYDSIRLYINHEKGVITPEIHEFYECSEERIPVGRILVYIGLLFSYLIGLYYIGFIYSTPVITLAVAGLLGIKRIFIAAISVIVFTIALYYASFYGLQILLPSGILFLLKEVSDD